MPLLVSAQYRNDLAKEQLEIGLMCSVPRDSDEYLVSRSASQAEGPRTIGLLSCRTSLVVY